MKSKSFDEILPKLDPWWRAAYNFGKANETWFKVEPNSEEWKSWQRHFGEIGYTPTCFRQTLNAVTMPCWWPRRFT